MSIAFRPKQRPRSARDLAVGHLDDLLIITFGMWDYEGHFIEVEVEDVLQGHQLCETNLI
jgi:hypothetical protein